MESKKCSKCKRELPAITEFFSPNKTGKFGLYSICRKCKSEDPRMIETTKLRHLKNREIDLKRKREQYIENKEYRLFLTKRHREIRKIKQKQSFCTICNEKKKLQLASINHTYTEDPTDYLWLCRNCHILFDRLSKMIIIGVKV